MPNDAKKALILFLLALTVISCLIGCAWQGQVKGIDWSGRYNTCGAASDPVECGEDIQTVIETTVHAFAAKTGVEVDTDHVFGLIERIEFFARPMPCYTCVDSVHANERGEESRYKGLLLRGQDGYTINLQAQGCLAFTSLAHEVAHLLAEETLGLEDADRAHTLPFLWGPDGVVYAANKMAINEGVCNLDNIEWRVE